MLCSAQSLQVLQWLLLASLGIPSIAVQARAVAEPPAKGHHLREQNLPVSAEFDHTLDYNNSSGYALTYSQQPTYRRNTHIELAKRATTHVEVAISGHPRLLFEDPGTCTFHVKSCQLCLSNSCKLSNRLLGAMGPSWTLACSTEATK